MTCLPPPRASPRMRMSRPCSGRTHSTTTPAPVTRAGGLRRVLVVEDSATQAAALAALLEEHGYETVVARDGAAALARVADTALDLVLSDVVMPGLSGYEVCRRIKSELGRRDLPVVLLTGLSDPMDIIRGLESGADDYVAKPAEPMVLLARIRALLRRAEAKPTAGPAPAAVHRHGGVRHGGGEPRRPTAARPPRQRPAGRGCASVRPPADAAGGGTRGIIDACRSPRATS